MTTGIEELLVASKTACEEIRCEIGFPDPGDEDAFQTPDWLTELERAVEEFENEQAIEVSSAVGIPRDH